MGFVDQASHTFNSFLGNYDGFKFKDFNPKQFEKLRQICGEAGKKGERQGGVGLRIRPTGCVRERGRESR